MVQSDSLFSDVSFSPPTARPLSPPFHEGLEVLRVARVPARRARATFDEDAGGSEEAALLETLR